MKNSSDAADTPRDRVIPAAQDLAHTAADRVGPLAEAAADAIGAATDKISPLAHAAAERLGPLAQSAADHVGPVMHGAADRVTPIGAQAVERVSPLAQQAVDRVTPYAHQAVGAVAPLAAAAAAGVGPLAHSAVDAVGPYASQAKERGLAAGQDAADRFGPALGTARDKVTGELLPKVGAALTAAAALPGPTELVGRSRAVVSAALGSQPVEVVPVKKKSRWLTTLAVVAAGAAVAYVGARKLLGDKGSQWQVARPSTPYTPPPATPATTSSSTASTAAGTTDAAATDDTQGGETAHDAYAAADGAPEPDQPAEGGEPDARAGGTPDTTDVGSADVTADPSTSTLYGATSDPLDPDETDTTAENDLNATVEREADADEEVPPVPGTDDAGSSAATAASASTASSAAESGGLGEGGAASGDIGHSEEPVSEEQGSLEEHDTAIGGEAPVSTEDDNAAGVGPDTDPGRYAEHGAYVGVEPPEGYVIKANERSMKYHVPDAPGYNRTISEIWFATEDQAQAAGFTRAQH